MRKAFDQPDPPGFIEWLKMILNEFLRSVFNGLKWMGTKIRLVKQAEHIPQAIDVGLDPKFRRHSWTKAHSLYATMGGFVVDTRGLDQNYLKDGQQRMTLTLQGLKYVANWAPDILPDLHESAIIDKSKANAFTKLVTCGQASWFGVQCLTRSVQGLSISLLEINTAVHAICTLGMCVLFWWHKPLDVEEPTILTHADTHPVIAFLVAGQTYRNIRVSLMDMEGDNALDLVPDSGTAIHHPNLNHILLKPSKDPSFPPLLYVVYDGFAIPASRSISNKIVDDLTESDFERLKLASQAIRKYGSYTETLRHMSKSLGKDHYLIVRSRNRPISMDTDSDAETSWVFGFPLAGLFYGGVHLLVWNRPFRNETEKLLWKISNLTILLSGTPLVAWLCYESLPKRFLQRLPKQVHSGLEILGLSFFFAFTLFYVLCRLFVIVECFLDVFHLPDSAFEVPRWSQYFPHV